jgi:hypothetical protein
VGENYRISLKAGKTAQFMSSHTDEAVSIFEAAMEYMKDNSIQSDMNALIDKVESALTVQVDSEFKIGNLLDPIEAKKDELSGIVKDELARVKEIKKIHKDLTARKPKKVGRKDKEKYDKYMKGMSIKGWPKPLSPESVNWIKEKKNNKFIKGEIEKIVPAYSLTGKGKVSASAFGGVRGKVFPQNSTDAQKAEIKSISGKAMEKLYFDQTKFQDEISEDLTVFFNDNKEFKEYFVFEAASGVKKFTDAKPKANWALIFKTDGTVLNLEKIADGDSPTPWIKGKSTSANFRCNWKNHGSSSTRGTYPSIRAEFDEKKVAARLADAAERRELNNQVEYSTMSELITGELNSFVMRESVLIEEALHDRELINEGLLSWGKSKIKKLYNKMKDVLYGIVTKIGESVRALAKKGMDLVLDFLGVELGSVTVTGMTW